MKALWGGDACVLIYQVDYGVNWIELTEDIKIYYCTINSWVAEEEYEVVNFHILSNYLKENYISLVTGKGIEDLESAVKKFFITSHYLKQLTYMIIFQEVCGSTLGPCCTTSQIFPMKTPLNPATSLCVR